MTSDPGDIRTAAEQIKAAGECAPRPARDPVNRPMINNWTEALGDRNPLYAVEGLAPPAMIQVWTMAGLDGQRTSDDPLGLMMTALDAAGFTSVVATNCEQTYHRYLREGEQLTVTTRLDDVVGPKRTALGAGWFVTTRNVWYVGAEPVAEMLFRVLKFLPAPAAPSRADTLRPVVSHDTAFFWAGTAAGELRIQQCPNCGTLRHPPGPMCMSCGHDKPDYVLASGRGTVFSYVVHHHPPVPGKTLPFVVALVELEEGVRMLGELVGVDPADVDIDMPVELALTRIDDELTLPLWRPTHPADQQSPSVAGRPSPSVDHGGVAGDHGGVAGDHGGERGSSSLPELEIEATPTFVVASALATRDFQDVHHDRDRAVARGSKDIFLNILTDTGLVQRFVTDWAGPDARIRSISLRLGVPCYAYDTLRFSGDVVERVGDLTTVRVTGRDSLGEHVIATVTFSSTPPVESQSGPENDSTSGGEA